MEAVRDEEVKLRGVGFVKKVGFKLGVNAKNIFTTLNASRGA